MGDDVATCPLCKQPVHWDTEHYPHAWRHEHVSRWCLAEPGKHPVYPTGATDRAAR